MIVTLRTRYEEDIRQAALSAKEFDQDNIRDISKLHGASPADVRAEINLLRAAWGDP